MTTRTTRPGIGRVVSCLVALLVISQTVTCTEIVQPTDNVDNNWLIDWISYLLVKKKKKKVFFSLFSSFLLTVRSESAPPPLLFSSIAATCRRFTTAAVPSACNNNENKKKIPIINDHDYIDMHRLYTHRHTQSFVFFFIGEKYGAISSWNGFA